MQKETRLLRSIARGIDFIAHKQQPRGNFLGESIAPQKESREVDSFFDTPLIAGALLNAERLDQRAQTIIDKATVYVAGQQCSDGTYNYWDTSSPLRHTFPYPNDMDDTALGWSLLLRQKHNTFDESLLVSIVATLTRAEVAVGGPYNTWLCDFRNETRWHDVDVCVNANIAYAFKQVNIELPNLTSLFEEKILNPTYTSKYYPSKIVVAYFISRAYFGELTSKLLWDAQRHFDELEDPTMIEHACLVSIYATASYTIPKELIEKILSGQESDGSWNCEPLYFDPKTEGVMWQHGSKALTTAFCVEALTHTVSLNEVIGHNETITIGPTVKDTSIVTSIVRDAYAAHRIFGEQIESVLEHAFFKNESSNITHLPRGFYDSLDDGSHTISPEVLDELGYVGLLGWIGYTLLDDILDGEADLSVLPSALWCVRNVTVLSERISPEGHSLTDEILSGIERAYQDEQLHIYDAKLFPLSSLSTNMKIPTFEKSLGHALPVLLLLSLLGMKESDTRFTATKDYFMRYLCARQLIDDMHDIKDDFRHGRMTRVTHAVLVAYGKGHPEEKDISVLEKESELLLIFWEECVEPLSAEIRQEFAFAKKALEEMGLRDRDHFLGKIEALERSIEKATSEQSNMKRFLKKYQE